MFFKMYCFALEESSLSKNDYLTIIFSGTLRVVSVTLTGSLSHCPEKWHSRPTRQQAVEASVLL